MAVTKKVIRGLKRLRLTISELATDLLVGSEPIGTKFNAYRTYLGDGLLAHGTLAVDDVPEKFKTTTRHAVRVNGESIGVAAATAIAFSAAHKITAEKFGVILVQRTHTGTISTKVPASTQAYDTADLAIAAKPSPDAGNYDLGHIVIEAGAEDWDAQTDDMTAESDVASVTFYNATPLSLPSALT